MSYRPGNLGDWGRMQETPDIRVGTLAPATIDTCRHYLRSWKTGSSDILLIMHGLGGHSGWYIDMGNKLASRGLTVYAMDHRGFGRSGGLPGYINSYHTYIDDIVFLLGEIHERNPGSRVYVLGHSMGGLFAIHLAAAYGEMLDGILLLNPWIQDISQLSFFKILAIMLGGFFKSKRYWQVAGDTETMTTNPDAIRMLQHDPLWRREQTASQLFQVTLMRFAAFSKAKGITLPMLLMQAGKDKAIDMTVNKKLYDSLSCADKTWIDYPNYAHDSEFEPDRSQMDNDIFTWITEHAKQASDTPSSETSDAI